MLGMFVAFYSSHQFNISHTTMTSCLFTTTTVYSQALIHTAE